MDINELANLAAQTEDQTEVSAGGDYEYTPPAAGKTIARFIEYIELGMHKQKPYQGKAKPDADRVRLTFELLHPVKNIKEIEVNGEKKTVSEIISFEVSKKLNDRASFTKIFKKLAYERADKKHMAQCLGDAYIVEVFHNADTKDPKKVYANLNDKDGNYSFAPPIIEDPIEGTKKTIKVPDSLRPKKIFLWDHANQEMWDSLYIDGTREVKNGDTVTQVSKNWLQEKIMDAVNYKGSKLEQLLAGVADLTIKEEPKKEEVKTTSTDAALDMDEMSVLGLN